MATDTTDTATDTPDTATDTTDTATNTTDTASTRKLPGWSDGEFGHQLGLAINSIIDIIKRGIAGEHARRSEFTKRVISEMNTENPHFNYAICHVAHDRVFNGARYQDWNHRHQELDAAFGTVGYEIYWFRSGTFNRKGDGGYLNWAYTGNVTSKSADGRLLVFGERP